MLRCVLALAIALLVACSRSPAEPTEPWVGQSSLTPITATSDWPTSTPEGERLDTTTLTDLVRRISAGDYGYITSLLIARNGRLVVEEYFGRWTPNRAHTMQSVSKSVTSLLAGIAVDDGRLSVDTRVADMFPDYEPIANRVRAASLIRAFSH